MSSGAGREESAQPDQTATAAADAAGQASRFTPIAASEMTPKYEANAGLSATCKTTPSARAEARKRAAGGQESGDGQRGKTVMMAKTAP